jgi:hypothetical protein
MLTETGLSTAQVLDVFTEEVEARGGTTRDVWVDDEALFARSVVGLTAEVKNGDEVRGGVAIRASAEGIKLSPYMLRVVCTNGAIMARAEETLVLDDLQFRNPDDVLATVRRGVVACADEEIFLDSVEDMRRSNEASDLMSVHVLTLLAHLVQRHRGLRGHASLRQFVDGSDRTLFGLGNVITAIGRDTTDPRRKWELEELGGGVLVGALKPPPGSSGHAALSLRGGAEFDHAWGGGGSPLADRWLVHASTSLRESSADSLHS